MKVMSEKTINKVAVVAHDAGGAEVLSSYVAYDDSKVEYIYFLSGPAVRIFSDKLKNVINNELLEEIKLCDAVLSSTGWQTDHEWSGMLFGVIFGKKVMVYLDHWVNYRDRFVRNGLRVKPDEVWVGDKYAYRKAKELFFDVLVCYKKNRYLEGARNRLKLNDCSGITSSREKVLLYIGENIEVVGGDSCSVISWIFSEFVEKDVSIDRVVVRPHPSEREGKYIGVKEKINVSFDVSDGGGLLDDIKKSDIVVGHQSMALIIALSAGKEVYSYIPYSDKSCSLPYIGINKVCEI